MKGFSGFKSPVKKVSQKITEGFSKNQHNYGKTTKVTTTMKDGSTSFVEKSQKTGRTVGSGSTSAKYAKPKFDPMKTIYAGTPEHKQFMKSAKKAIAKGPKVSKKPTSLATRAFRGFKNVAKGLGRRATGVAGMMMGTMGTALGNTNQGVGFKGEGSARRLFNKRKKK